MTRSLLLVCLFALLSGCGQKGPLYLPADKPQAVQGQAPAPTATDKTQDTQVTTSGVKP